MGSTCFNPSCLYQTPSGYIFRFRVPADIKPVVGRVEFRYSLRSGALRVAKHRARCIAPFIQQLFEKVRNGMAEFTSEKIKRMVQEYVRETLINDEKCRAISGPTTDGTMTLPGMSILESSDMKSEEAESLLKSVNRWPKNQDHSLMKTVTEKLLKAEGQFTGEGAEIAPESKNYKTLGRELLKAFQVVLQVRIKRSEGDYAIADSDLIHLLKQEIQNIPEHQKVNPEERQVMRFSEIQNHYIAEVEKGENWTEKTKAEKRCPVIGYPILQSYGPIAISVGILSWQNS